MKKKILIGSVSAILFCLISFLILSTHSVDAAESNEKYVAAKSGINLRSGAGKSSSVITLIPFGSKVTVEKSDGKEIFLDGRYGKWVNVKFGDKTGWLFSGFLCDFEPNTIIKPVADFYRDKYRKDELFSKYKEYTHFKDSEVFIANIIDNYIVLEIPTSERDIISPFRGNVVWRYDVKQKNFFEAYNYNKTYNYAVGRGNTTRLFYLDDDKYIDMVVEDGCCSSPDVHIFLGSENGFTKVYDLKDDCNSDSYYYLTEGSCGDMEFACSKIDSKKAFNETMYHFKYDCKKRKVEKYAESKIIESSGIVTSVDWGKMTVAIKDKKDSKDTSYKISDKYKFPDKTYYFAEHVESIKKDLKKGKDVSFSYVTIDGEKIIIDIKSN